MHFKKGRLGNKSRGTYRIANAPDRDANTRLDFKTSRYHRDVVIGWRLLDIQLGRCYLLHARGGEDFQSLDMGGAHARLEVALRACHTVSSRIETLGSPETHRCRRWARRRQATF